MASLDNSRNTAAVLQKYGLHAQKKYGQNFLVDRHILEGIVSAAEIAGEDFVLEIGPGIGTMTQYLCEAADAVLAVEIDANFIPVLSDTLSPYDNVEVINADILRMDLAELLAERAGGRTVKVVANLPYYITTPIIMELFESRAAISSITVMVQREVADRMQAGPGTKDYGALSLAVQYYAKPKIVQTVPPECFLPQPKVGSAVVNLTRYREPPVAAANEKLLFQTIRAAFNQRRKTLVNALANSGAFSLTKEELAQCVENLGLPANVRGEALTLEQFAALSNSINFF